MCRRIWPNALAVAFLLGGVARAETGVREAHAAARVSVSIPSVHGADIPSRPAASSRVTFAASRSQQGSRLEVPALRVMSSNGDGSIQLVRRVRDAGVTAAASSTSRKAAREDVSTASRGGATGWTEINDELEVPAVQVVSLRPGRVTVIYEVWSF